MYGILVVKNVPSNHLQEKCATLGKAAQIIHWVIQSTKSYLNDEKFMIIWIQIIDFTKNHQVPLENTILGKKLIFLIHKR